MTEEHNIPDEVERLPDTDVEWGADEPAPQKKRGCFLPTWLWACGGGCLLALILTVGGGFYCVGQGLKAMDPEVQWPRMQKVLPFDERPEHVQMLAGMQMFGMENYTLMDFQRGLQISVYYFDDDESSDAADSRWTFFDPEKKTTSSSMINRANERLGFIKLGSRDRKVMRFTQETISFGSEVMRRQGAGPCLAVDVTPEDSPGFLFVMFFEAGGEFEIPDEHVHAFFESFYLD